MSKKALTILFFFLVIIGAIIGYTYLLFRGNTSPDPNGEVVTEPKRNFFFFLGGDNDPTTPEDPTDEPIITPGDVISETPTVNIPRLRKLSEDPVAGGVASSTESDTIVRFIERGTGHILESSLNLLSTPKTISNTTIPKIYEALWNSIGDKVIIRYPNDSGLIRTFSGDVKEKLTVPSVGSSTENSISETTHEIKGLYLSSDIKTLTLSPKTDQLFYILTTPTGATGYVSTLNEGSRSLIFSSPLKGWQVDWPETNIITLTTSPTAVGTGHMYTLNPKTGEQKKILGGIRGLTTLTSKDGKKVLYSWSNGNEVETRIYDVAENRTVDAPFITLSEKCVWGNLSKRDLYCAIPIEIPSGAYPDHWYQGKVSFIDQIWYINTDTENVQLLANLYEESGEGIDAVNLKLDSREDYLIFTNKSDLSLWALDIKE